MPEQGVSDLEKKTAAQTVGKVDAADPSLAADRLGIRIQRDGFERPFAGTKPEPEAEKVGNAEAFGLLLDKNLPPIGWVVMPINGTRPMRVIINPRVKVRKVFGLDWMKP